MGFFYFPYFVSATLGYTVPIGFFLLVIYFLAVNKGTLGSKVFVDLGKVLHYSSAYLTHTLAFVGFIGLVQGYVNLLWNKPTSAGLESLGTDFDPNQYARQDLSDSFGVLVAAALIYLFSYMRLRYMRKVEKNNLHDNLLHRLYFVGVLLFLGLYLISPLYSLAASIASYLLLNNGQIDGVTLGKSLGESWLNNGVPLVVTLVLLIYNYNKLRKLGENI